MLPFIFADDTKCPYAAKTNTDFTAIQEDLNMARNWSKECSLSFNCSKSAVIHFWCNHETPATLNNNYIETRDSIKDLGVMITSNLSWSNYCNMITAKAYKQLGLIRRSFTTNCVSAKKHFIFPWCDHNSCIALKSGDYVLFRTYYSLKESNGELQSIFLMTTLHLIVPDFSNYQCSRSCTFLN